MNEPGTKPPGGQAGRRFNYGYVIVGLIFLIHFIVFSISDSFGVWLNPWVDFFDWSRSVISGAYSLAFLISGIVGILAGIITDRFGPRLALSACALFLGAGYTLMSRMQSSWELYLTYGLLFGVGLSGVWAPLLSLISRWFSRGRGLITGVVISGGGLGAFVGPPLISALIADLGWREAALILGLVALAAVLLAAQFLRPGPSPSASLDDAAVSAESSRQTGENDGDFSLKEALATRQFWLIFSLFFCLAFYTFSVLVHLVPQAVQLKISREDAARVLGSISGMSILGNFVMGGIGDRIGPRRVFVVSFTLMSAALFWLSQAATLWGLYLFALVFGFNHGGNATAQAPLTARLFGLKAHATIFAACGLGFTLGGSLGPLISGYIFDRSGSYTPAFLLCGVVGLVGLGLTLWLKPTKRIARRI